MGVAAETSAPHVAAASTATVSMLAMAVRLRAGALREMGEPRAITDPRPRRRRGEDACDENSDMMCCVGD